jgi:diadenosine tetraphosphate (Ap4A) HIT family hydrolase
LYPLSSIFTKIVNGEIPCYKIAEDENYLAFLDVNPNAKGHTLCIPKFEIDKIFDMDEAHYLGHFLKKDCYNFRAGRSLQAHRYVSDWSRSTTHTCT